MVDYILVNMTQKFLFMYTSTLFLDKIALKSLEKFTTLVSTIVCYQNFYTNKHPNNQT